MQIVATLLLIGSAVVIGVPVLIVAFIVEVRRQSRLKRTSDVAEFTRLSLRDPVDCVVTADGPKAIVQFDLDKLRSLPGSADGSRLREFASAVRLIAPALFAKFKQFDLIVIEATCKMTDLRGHTQSEPYYQVVMSRTNSQSVNWPGIQVENIAKFSDEFWEHPSRKRQFERQPDYDD